LWQRDSSGSTDNWTLSRRFLGISLNDPIDDTVTLCRKLISAPRLALGGCSGRKIASSTQGFGSPSFLDELPPILLFW
jgi:hypothetical protein